MCDCDKNRRPNKFRKARIVVPESSPKKTQPKAVGDCLLDPCPAVVLETIGLGDNSGILLIPTNPPIHYDGNPDGGYKIDPPLAGVYKYQVPIDSETFVDAYIYNSNGSISSVAGLIISGKYGFSKILMKGGQNGALLYEFNPPATRLRELKCPILDNGKYPAISHISFELKEIEKLKVRASMQVDPVCCSKNLQVNLQTKSSSVTEWTTLSQIGLDEVNVEHQIVSGNQYRLKLVIDPLEAGWTLGYKLGADETLHLVNTDLTIDLPLTQTEYHFKFIFYYCSQYCQ